MASKTQTSRACGVFLYETLLSCVRTQVKMIKNELLVRRAICDLPVEIQHIVVGHLKEPPGAPIKSKRLQEFMDRWSDPKRPKVMPRALVF